MTTMEAVIEVMKVLLQRPDAPLFSPEELADRAFQYADAAAKRVAQYNDIVTKERMARTAQMYTTSIPITKADISDALEYALHAADGKKVRSLIDPRTAALWKDEK